MFRYLAQPTLDRLGMAGFDSWAKFLSHVALRWGLQLAA